MDDEIFVVYVVGTYHHESDDGGVSWSLDGIYYDEKNALASVTSYKQFIGPVKLNENLPDATWPGAYYPLREEA